MIKFFTVLSLAIQIFFQFSNFSFAQTDESLIWSIVKIDPSNVKETKVDNSWIPAEQIPRFMNIGDGVTVFPNFRPHPASNSTQSEVSVDVHPSNNNIVFCSANASDWPVSTIYGTGVYWTTNGATTWSGTDNPATLSGFGSNSGDPCSIIGLDGRLYENYISNAGGQAVSVSTNNGTNWTTYTIAPNPGSLADKNHYMVDRKASSPYLNRSYCAWTDFGGTNDEDAVIKYSTNYGQTWSSAINLSNSLSAFNHGVNIQTGPNGEVYATWAIYTGSGVVEDGVGFAKSTNGGATWTTPVYAYQQTNFGIRGYLSSKGGMRINSFPVMAVDRSGGSNNGTIYICWTQRGVSPAGSDPDVVFIKSTNGGTSWSSPVRVNNDALNNGKDQIFPWCTVDQATGQFMVVFYDSRNVANNMAEVYMACSLNGGSSFDNFAVSDQSFVLGPISGFGDSYGGDYIGISAHNNIAYPFWRDSRTGNAQGWMAKVTFGPPCPVSAPSNPNPINGATNVSRNLPQLSWANGAGSTKCEVWFGQSGSMSKVYDGNVISSWGIPSALNYNTSYNWQIVDKNDTCGSSGLVWAFTTELSPGIIFTENFNTLNCWTAIGPLGTTNWSTQSSSNAGGTSPELRLNWSPEFNGLSKFKSCAISVLSNRHYSVNLKHMLDWYANTAPTLGLGVSYDNGTTYTSIWNITPTGDVGPQTITATFTTPASTSNLNLILYCNGNSFNIDYWYIDDIVLNDDDYFAIADPTNVLATTISTSQINVAFTPNANNNNVVIVWNNTGSFTAPSGTPPAVGQPFAGGTLLYSGTVSPRNHTGLNPLTTYYYKLFSYSGTSYSAGIQTNATTLNVSDPTNVLATPISGSQINLSFTPNASNNNVVIVWNLSGTFTTPTGTPPVVGQPFAGGTLLYNGTTSPVNHTGLNGLTTYYYKAYSYNGVSYSPGVTSNATTLSLLDFGVGILVYDDCSNSVSLVFGTAPGAIECYDAGLDIVAPPPPPGGVFYGSFISCNDGFFTDIKGTNLDEERIWTIQYQRDSGCNLVNFSWDPSELPVGGYFHLVDALGVNLVNVNMRTTNQYTDVQGLGYLQIKYNYEFCSSYNINTGWNLISLPLEVTSNNYLTLFPTAVSGTLYGYSGSYFSTETLENTAGYWLKFPSSQTSQVCGLDRTESVVALNAGWNMIGGPNCNVPLGSVGDPGGIIIPGTLYGYSGSYSTATYINATKAYWIKATASGTITVSCGASLANSFTQDIFSDELLAEFSVLEVGDANNGIQTLYFNGDLGEDINIESFSMPPLPPSGSFDARLMGDYRLTESDEATIQIQSADYPIRLTVTNLNSNESYVLKQIANGIEVESETIIEGSEIIVSNPEVTVLKLSNQQSIPTTYNLEQNYPNPFNPSTTIKFSLPEAANAKLTIYNALGEMIVELVNTNLEAGWYNYQWNAGDIASGMYIYELRTDKFISIKKMLLLK